MATQVLVAHTGQRLRLDSSQLVSLDDFKAAVSRQTSIPANYIITLTPQGKPLKVGTFQAEKEVYVYDIRVTQATSPGASSATNVELPLPKRYTVSNPPNDLRDQRSVQSWQELFRARQVWALKVAGDCAGMAQEAQDRYAEMDVMLRCLDAAVANLEAVVKGVEQKYTETKKWVGSAHPEYNALVNGWEHYLGLARSVPISAAMLHFMTGRDVSLGPKGKPARQATLEDLIDLETARRASKLAPAALRKFGTRVTELERSAPLLFQGCEDVMRGFEQLVGRSTLAHEGEPAQLLQDIEAVAKKIDTDYQTTLEYSDSTRDILQTSRIAANHTERLLPSMKNRAREMDEMLQYATEARNALALESVDFMRSITELTSISTTVKSQVNVLNDEEDLSHFDYLRLIQQIPYVYASFVTEAIRRREWVDKAKTDSSTLANEMALFHDEEVKRRRKWYKTVGNLAYGPPTPAADNQVPGLEVNLVGEEDEWPNIQKKELDDFLEALRQQKADADLVEDIGKMIAELGSPTKQQTKRLKAFKNGSVHEAALGRSGLLLRGDDEVMRSLQDDKSKLESKLKTAESRVRRLEDLLHRQSQTSRPNIFQPSTPQLSERNESTGSVKSARVSDDRRKSLEGGDLRLLQRIQQLETELSSEKERSAVLEKDLNARTTQHNDIKGQMEEANSTKTDLLQNMEALKREFMEERKSLEDEIKRLHARLEDTEDEMEHFGESRENEKASYDEKLRTLQMEIDQLSKERRDETLKNQGQVEFLRKESRLQRERNESLEKQLQTAQEECQAMIKRLQSGDEVRETQLKALRELHDHLSPDEGAPDDLADLVDGVSSKLTGFLSRFQALEGDVALLKTDLDLAQAAAKDLRAEIALSKEKLSEEEMTSLRLREKLSEEKARVAALEEELFEERGQLSQLRVKIADGETGSETLRKRLEEEERKITSLSEELASKQSHVGSLEEELRLFQEKFHESQSELASLVSRFQSRTERTKDLTQKLYTQNDRLCRLLERLGFSVTREGSSMSIQKIPRSERSTQLLPPEQDGAGSVRRSSLLNNTASRSLSESVDLELLYWMNSPDPDTEAEKYAAYLSNLGSFDVDAFSETVYRRVKEVEHVARKLQRDVRAYRDKAHALQKEAHEKIAYKHFKEGDLALFLPTRNQTNGAWAAFNIGFPHYFLREQEGHRLRNREWLLARISRIQEKVVDLSKSLHGGHGETESLNDEENDNPFDLSDGLRWYMIDAVEDKPGAPSTPGLAKSTVAANNVEAMADMHTHSRTASGKGLVLGGRPTGIDGVSKSLHKSLESRRSSTSSKKALPFAGGGGARGNAVASETNSLRAAAPDTPVEASPTLPHGQTDSADANHNIPPPTPTGGEAHNAPEARVRPKSRLQREQSAASIESPVRRSVVWDSLWSLDYNYEGGRKGK